MSHSIGREIAVLNSKIQMYVDRVMKQLDLSCGTFRFLIELYEKEGLSISEISRLAECDIGTASRGVDHLVNKGYAIKLDDENHGKKKIVKLTEKGIEAREPVLEALNEVSTILLEGMNSDEEQVLRNSISKMKVNILAQLKGNK